MRNILLALSSAALLASCSTGGDDNTAENKARMQEFTDQVINAHNPAMIDSFITADFNDHQLTPQYGQGLEGLRAAMADWFIGFPDVHAETNFMLASGDTVVAVYTMTGTNTGPMMGMPPTNKSFEIQGVDIIVVKDGRATEHWGFSEEMKMMMQLGMMPEMGAPADSTAMAPAEL